MDSDYYDKFMEQLAGFSHRLGDLKKQREDFNYNDVELLEQAFQELNIAMEEVQVAEEELRSQNEELIGAHALIDAQRQHYQDLFQSSPDGYLVTDMDGHILEMNMAAEWLLNNHQDTLRGKLLIVFVGQADRVLFRQRLDQAERLKKIDNWELQIKPTQREPFDASITFVVLKGYEGVDQAILWILRDITERKAAQNALKRSEERFRRIFQNAEIGIVLVDEKSKLAEVNPAMRRMLGYDQAELQNTPVKDLFAPETAGQNCALIQQVLSGELHQYTRETTLVGKQAKQVWATLSVSQYERNDSSSPYAILMVEDKTQQKLLQNELGEMRRKIIIGNEVERQRLSEHLHDGPLQDLYGVFYQLNTLVPELEPGETKKQLENARAMLLTILNDLRMVSYDLRPPALSHYGLAKAILSYTERFKQRYPQHDIHLVMENDEKKLSNDYRLALFRNFQQAMNNIARHSKAHNVWIGLDIEKGQVLLEVKDDGQGLVPPESWVEMAREGHLGLASCAERSEALDGRMEVISAPGKGTIFRTILPFKEATRGMPK